MVCKLYMIFKCVGGQRPSACNAQGSAVLAVSRTVFSAMTGILLNLKVQSTIKETNRCRAGGGAGLG